MWPPLVELIAEGDIDVAPSVTHLCWSHSSMAVAGREKRGCPGTWLRPRSWGGFSEAVTFKPRSPGRVDVDWQWTDSRRKFGK